MARAEGTSLSRRGFLATGALAAASVVEARSSPAQAANVQRPVVDVVPEPLQAAAVEGFIDVPGARLHYWDTGGNGQTIVLLHPASGSAESWTYQQPVFAAAGYRVIAYSRRGHYRSEAVGEPVVPSPTDLDDLHALVTQLNLGRFHLVGSAAGSFLGAEFTVAFPDRLHSALLGSSLLNFDDPDFGALVKRLIPANFMQLPADFRELSPSYRVANPQGVARWLEIEKRSRWAPMGPILNTGTAGPRPPGRVPVTFDTLNVAAGRLPVLLMTADADLYMSPALLGMVAAKVPNARTTIVANAGHAVFWEQPRAYNRTVLEFIGRRHA